MSPIQTIREALEILRGAVGHADTIATADRGLAALAELEKQEPVAWLVEGRDDTRLISHGVHLDREDAKSMASAFAQHYPIVHTKALYSAAPVAQQPQAEAQPVAWRARDANGRWMYGDLPAPDLPAGEPELLALAAPPQAEAVDDNSPSELDIDPNTHPSYQLPQAEAVPERDTTKPAEQQGLFRKFVVRRTDGSDVPGGRHDGCDHFVLDTTHDKCAKAALAAYATAVEETHPQLAADMRARYQLAAPQQAEAVPPEFFGPFTYCGQPARFLTVLKKIGDPYRYAIAWETKHGGMEHVSVVAFPDHDVEFAAAPKGQP